MNIILYNFEILYNPRILKKKFLLTFHFGKGLIGKELLQFNNKKENNSIFENKQKIIFQEKR